MALNARARLVVRGVQELRDERDELLNILGGVLDGVRTEDSETAVAVLPTDLMNEIRRRVAHQN